MKIIKKLLLNLFVVTFALIFFSSEINIFAKFEYSNDYATYRVKEVANEKYLGYGVDYRRDISTLSTNVSGVTNNAELKKEYGQQVNVLEIDPNEEVQLVPYAFLDGSNWVHTTLKKAAMQYEATHPGYKVIAGVNGDYFYINDSVKASVGVTISQGEYYKTISGHSGVNTIAIKNNGEGKQLSTITSTNQAPVLSIYDENDNVINKIIINKVNEEPGSNETALYYADRETNFGYKVSTINASNIFVVNRGLYAVTTMKGSFYGIGKVTSFESGVTTLGSGQFGIKTNNEELLAILNAGVASGDLKIRCQYEYTDESLKGVENFIGFPFKILENEEVIKHDAYRHPRTIIGQKENGEIVLAVVDGRQGTKDMYGASSVEMAALMSYYGCVDAWNLDGGGSSTMIVRKLQGWDFDNAFNDTDADKWYVTNSPSDGGERSDGNHLLVVVKAPEVELDVFEFGEDFITLHVALISDIEKYKDLYILYDGEYYEVQENKVTITGLKKNTQYKFYVFAEVDGEYFDLLVDAQFKTNKPAPTNADVHFSILEKNDVKRIFIRYDVDVNDAVSKIVLIINEERYLTVSSTIQVDFNEEFLKNIVDAKLEITYQLNPDLPEEILLLENINMIYDTKFILENMLYLTSQAIIDSFNN